MTARRVQRALVAALVAVPVVAVLAQLAFDHPWWTPDQTATRLYRAGDYGGAAERFRDPAWRAAALYRDGRFEDAAAVWSGVPGAEARFNRGNALVFRGLYEDAVKSYDAALELRPDWTAARRNRDIAQSRIRTETALGEASELGADDVVFDPDKKNEEGGDSVEVTAGDELGDDALRALWLRNVQTEPADFLRAKFAYQHSVGARSVPEEEPR